MLARNALAVFDALGAQPGRANVGCALAVRGADGVIAEVVLAIAEEIAVFSRAAAAVAHALSAQPR